ncbi:MAG: Asp-tRNA(Asn)/Glu-tRNA(Gln) amidotransferase subunit GatB [candidate division KSB1 bacterium]|jgi:aspartyl-tRNA(Asn)/glutamyl-tRNA(Gln) amidotransferase subunit B|nr:Asp-tRNA(Asn)/Glu-tRNA(Gln) amidotransferase subunit GatB [candidate division KSB1 bacterium]
MKYEPIICFETHVELKTKTKLFCGCAVSYGDEPNRHICPVCTGQPGALPVLNSRAVELCVRTGLTLNCSINKRTRFARKNYFYPDLPKGYQISQYELPFCENGFLEIQDDNGNPYAVGIRRIHLEEDAGKLVHSSESFDSSDYSLVDYNRACIPLLEIVGDHERNPLRSLVQAKTYLDKLRQILRYIDVSDCMMELGQLRCDVNVSLRPRGSNSFGNRTEIKNMSSFRFILEAAQHEIKRQSAILDAGGQVEQETRLYNEMKKETIPMRSKEDAPDYRYFPEPDLVEVVIEEETIEKSRQALPELPDDIVKRLTTEYDIPYNDALVLTRDRQVVEYFDKCASDCKDARRAVRWINRGLFELMNEASISIADCKIAPENFAALINLISDGVITETIARDALAEMFKSGEAPQAIIERKGLKPIQDASVMEGIVDTIMSGNPDVITRIRGGETKLIEFLLGQVMKESRGKANPKTARELIMRKFEENAD